MLVAQHVPMAYEQMQAFHTPADPSGKSSQVLRHPRWRISEHFAAVFALNSEKTLGGIKLRFRVPRILPLM